ncbi:hypothetical protein T484DRAFT_1756655 [Baffinella frigidus]|nr:hypothetical protein T484DRAFT_1756655 [Cryptophyta sp. CCMP2293]
MSASNQTQPTFYAYFVSNFLPPDTRPANTHTLSLDGESQTKNLTIALNLTFCIMVVMMYHIACRQGQPSGMAFNSTTRIWNLNKMSAHVYTIMAGSVFFVYELILYANFVLPNGRMQKSFKSFTQMNIANSFTGVGHPALWTTITAALFVTILFSNKVEHAAKPRIARFLEYTLLVDGKYNVRRIASVVVKAARMLFVATCYVICTTVVHKKPKSTYNSAEPLLDLKLSIVFEFVTERLCLVFATQYMTILNPVNAMQGFYEMKYNPMTATAWNTMIRLGVLARLGAHCVKEM